MKRISVKLWVSMMTLIIIMLGLLWVFQIYFLENYYNDTYVEKIKKDVVNILNSVDYSTDDIKYEMMSLSCKNNMVAEVYKYNGESVFVVEQITNGGSRRKGKGDSSKANNNTNSFRKGAFQEALQGKENKIRVNHPKFPIENIVISMRNQYREWIIFLTIPISSANDTVELLKAQLVYITLIILIVSTIITIFLSRSFTKPLKEITKASEKISKGNFNVDINVTSKDEIGKLAKSINNMAVELNKSDQLKRDIIGNVSHELKSPLGLIQGYTQMIRDVSINDPVKREKHFDIIQSEIKRLSKIVDDILSLSKIQSGNIVINEEKIEVVSLLRENIDKFAVMSNKFNIPIVLNTYKEVYAICDRGRINQVVFNLLNNALNHMNSGKITIDVEEEIEFIRISIRDTGKGINEKDIEHIWDKFFTSKKTSKEKIYGTGLGLSIVKSIFEACGMTYGVNSELGKGTNFWFEIKKA